MPVHEPSPEISRRGFLGTSALLTAASLSNVRSYAANDRVGHAVIGVGGQGRSHARGFSSLDTCELRMLCDLDERQLEKAREELPNVKNVKTVTRFEEVFENPDIHTVSIASPDHWHTPLALLALKAGKHVYVEKPCSHNIYEGVALEKAQQKTGLCVQHGTQHRSGQGVKDAIAFMREGGLGKIRVAKAINHQFRGPIGRKAAQDPPPGVDYDRWLGPAPEHPFTENRWHYNWHWFWDYGCGDIGNDGIHQVDVARWGLGVDYPIRVDGPGGQLFYEDDHQTPDTQLVTYQYDDCYLIYEMRLWTDYKLEGHDNGVVFYGDKGKVEIGRQGSFVYETGKEPVRIGGSHDFTANLANFIECAKAGDPSKLNAPAQEAAASAALCHLGNIATRVGRGLQYDHAALACKGDEEATTLLKREYRQGYELAEV